MVQKRWFIGALLPPIISDAIISIQRELINDDAILPPLMPHITLMHPNPLMELSPLHFAPLAKKAAHELLPCEILLGSIGTFNDSVLYISVKSPELTQIHNQLVALLPSKIQSQYFVRRDFVPHVTLAQSRGLNKLSHEIITQFTHKIEPLLPTKFTLQKLTRYEWQGSRTYLVKDL